MENKYEVLVSKIKEMYLQALEDHAYAQDMCEYDYSYDTYVPMYENNGIAYALGQLLEESVVSSEEIKLAIQKGHDRYISENS